MSESYFFSQVQKNEENAFFLENVNTYALETKSQIYVVDSPLGDNSYEYEYADAFVILAPKYKILICHSGKNHSAFDDYCEDFLEDLGSLSDKYGYRKHIGRPRSWDQLIWKGSIELDTPDLSTLLEANRLDRPEDQRKCELLISLLTGSINDIAAIKADVPQTLLEKVKRKIILFDGDQTRFIYQKVNKKRIIVQGLSGTGKTELLLHKLKEVYVGSDHDRVIFTCHNRVLADNVRRRIPEFFNFMRVQRQIEWETRLWCVNAWGRRYDHNSGCYRLICNYYGLNFQSYDKTMNFERVCELAIAELGQEEITDYVFDYMFIDESQDFPESFFKLCELVTRNTVYVAGDIFQNIFDEIKIDSIAPDLLLSKCYRTDPRTLMFAHALGMGLFENPKLRWLEDKEWEACGYILQKTGDRFYLNREPLRRFEDLKAEAVESVDLVKTKRSENERAVTKILSLLKTLRQQHPTLQPDDIAIVFIDKANYAYQTADELEQAIYQQTNWVVNKAYETKEIIPNTLCVTNVNNVKGLEFPFVICVTKRLNKNKIYRNSLYMALSRSFIKSFLLLSSDANLHLLPQIENGLDGINTNGYINLIEPTEEEKQLIRTTISMKEKQLSLFDYYEQVFRELRIPYKYHKRLREIVNTSIDNTSIDNANYNKDKVTRLVKFNYDEFMLDEKNEIL